VISPLKERRILLFSILSYILKASIIKKFIGFTFIIDKITKKIKTMSNFNNNEF
jgi:hypothetical protein